MSTPNVRKIDPQRWDSVADLARWMLTHADEYQVAVVVLQERDREAGDPIGEIETFTCPQTPIVRVLGLLEVAKQLYIDQSRDPVVAGEDDSG